MYFCKATILTSTFLLMGHASMEATDRGGTISIIPVAAAPPPVGSGHEIRRAASKHWHEAKVEEAKQLLRAAIETPENKVELAMALRQLGQYAEWSEDQIESHTCFTAFFQMTRDDPSLITRLSSAYRQTIYNLAEHASRQRDYELAASYTSDFLSRPVALEGEDQYLSMANTHSRLLAKQGKTDEAAAAFQSARDLCPSAWAKNLFNYEIMLLRLTDSDYKAEATTVHLQELWERPEALADPTAQSIGVALMQSYFNRSLSGDGMDVAYEISIRIPEWVRISSELESRQEIPRVSTQALQETLITVLSHLQGAGSHSRAKYVEYANAAMTAIVPADHGKVKK
jgi:tetratricopeptide (TPR) repeat protein